MLSVSEYAELAKSIEFSTKAYIAGEFVESCSGNELSSINPATEETIAQIPACDAIDLELAVNAARNVFEQGVWSALHPSQRKEKVLAWVDLIIKHQTQLAVLESLDSGKSIADCVEIDLPETIHCLRWYAEAIDKQYDQLSPSGNEAMGLIIKEPVGVVACVLPWNFPLLMLAWKVGPALASGNSLIIKPAEQTSLTALYVAKLAHEAGIPAGVFNVLSGYGETLGKSIGLHNDIDVVSFTGSTEVGRLFLQYSAQSNLKKIILECGGKSPSVVLSSAEHLDSIAENVVNAAFWNMGENCTANSRLIVHHSLKDSLVDKVLHYAKEWVAANPLNPDNKLGAMISREHYDQVLSYIESATFQGAKCIYGEQQVNDKGYYIQPMIFDNVTAEMTVAIDEIFGPVLLIMTVDSDEQALTLANNTAYGLQASVYSADISTAIYAAKKIKAGTVSINCYSEGDITTPFGGYKLSGFGGRDNSLQAFDQYTETKTIWMATNG